MMRSFLSFILLSVFTVTVYGHARLMPNGNLPPRNDNPGLKTAPCGGVAPTNNPTYLIRGSQLTINWEETIQHPGRYEFSISYDNEQTWQSLGVVQDTQDDRNDLPHRYSATFTLPDQACTSCTIQMIQVMTEDPANPRNYYSCADVVVVNNASEIPSGPPAPTPTPAPNNNTSSKDLSSHCE